MMLPQSSSLTMILPPGTAWHPFFHHSGSGTTGASYGIVECPCAAEACFFSHAARRFDAPRAAVTNDRRTSLRFFSEVCDSSVYRSCSDCWNLYRNPARSCSESAPPSEVELDKDTSVVAVIVDSDVVGDSTEVDTEVNSDARGVLSCEAVRNGYDAFAPETLEDILGVRGVLGGGTGCILGVDSASSSYDSYASSVEGNRGRDLWNVLGWSETNFSS